MQPRQERFFNNNNLEGLNLKIAISPRKSKTARQISDILSIFIQIFERNDQELGGSGGNGLFFDGSENHILADFGMKNFAISKISFPVNHLWSIP